MLIKFCCPTNTCSPTPSLQLPNPRHGLSQKFRFSLIASMSSTYLLIFFLCISLHACHARRLGTFDKKLEKKIHISMKNDDEKKGLDSPPKQVGLLKNVENGVETRLNATNNDQKPKDRRSIKLRVHKVKEKAILLGALRTKKSHVSVSWRVPHRRPAGEKNPGFNSDYSPPKTHPPSHN